MKEKDNDGIHSAVPYFIAAYYPLLHRAYPNALDSGGEEESGGYIYCGVFDYASFVLAGDGALYFAGKI